MQTHAGGELRNSQNKRMCRSRYAVDLAMLPTGDRVWGHSEIYSTCKPLHVRLCQPLAGGPGRSASSLLRLRRRQPSVSGTRLATMLDARSFMISTLQFQVGFAAAVAHARLRLAHVLSSSGNPALAVQGKKRQGTPRLGGVSYTIRILMYRDVS